jgi:hypothetical protein
VLGITDYNEPRTWRNRSWCILRLQLGRLVHDYHIKLQEGRFKVPRNREGPIMKHGPKAADLPIEMSAFACSNPESVRFSPPSLSRHRARPVPGRITRKLEWPGSAVQIGT